jgi:hypothetical protein
MTAQTNTSSITPKRIGRPPVADRSNLKQHRLPSGLLTQQDLETYRALGGIVWLRAMLEQARQTGADLA